MAKLIEHGLSFTEQRPDGSHKLGKRAVIIGAGIGGLATAGALAPCSTTATLHPSTERAGRPAASVLWAPEAVLRDCNRRSG